MELSQEALRLIQGITVTWTIISASLLAGITYLAKTFLAKYLENKLESYKSELQKNSEIEIQKLRSKLELENQKSITSFNTLHSKTGELIADLYRKLSDIEDNIRGVQHQIELRKCREEVDQLKPYTKDIWELRYGIDTLTTEESDLITQFNKNLSDFWITFKRNKIYFPRDFCTSIEKYSSSASFVASKYSDMAIKNDDNQLFVSTEAKEFWDTILKSMPKYLEALESEFRALGGASN